MGCMHGKKRGRGGVGEHEEVGFDCQWPGCGVADMLDDSWRVRVRV